MGLKSGPHGFKSEMKARFARAFRRYDTLANARDDVVSNLTDARERTCVLLDMNVVFMSVPEAVLSYRAFLSVVHRAVSDALRAGGLVIGVLDEPEHVTAAKREEQARRDEARLLRRNCGDASASVERADRALESIATLRSREDAAVAVVEPMTVSDDLGALAQAAAVDVAQLPPPEPLSPPRPQRPPTRHELETSPNVHLFKDDRACRIVLYDELCRDLLELIRAETARVTALGHEHGGTLLLDGVDLRGATRALDERRVPRLVGTDDEAVGLFTPAAPIGEGDLKLIEHETRVRQLAATRRECRWGQFALVVTSTVDTDSLPISLLRVARRRVATHSVDAATTTVCVASLVAMREPPTKLQRQQDPHACATYACCDVVYLEGMLQDFMWSRWIEAERVTFAALAQRRSELECRGADAGEAKRARVAIAGTGDSDHHANEAPVPSSQRMLGAMLVFVAASALCGCDFTLGGLPGSRFDHFLETLPVFVADDRQAVDELACALDTDVARTVQSRDVLRRLCVRTAYSMSFKPRYKKQAVRVGDASDALLARAMWTVAYWDGHAPLPSDECGFATPLLKVGQMEVDE